MRFYTFKFPLRGQPYDEVENFILRVYYIILYYIILYYIILYYIILYYILLYYIILCINSFKFL